MNVPLRRTRCVRGVISTGDLLSSSPRRLLMSASILLVVAQLAAVSFFPARADIVSGLVAYYPLNGNGDDQSGQGRNGTLHGVIPAADRLGNPDGACWFGGEQYIDAPADGLPAAERSIAMWFLADSVGAPCPTLVGYGEFCGRSWYEVVCPTGLGRGSHCDVQSHNAAYGVGTDVWHHWVVTTSAQGTQFYMNGTPIAWWPDFVNDTYVPGTEIGIGVATGGGAGQAPYTDGSLTYWRGAIDEVRIYDRALSDEDVRELYTLTTPVVPTTFGRIKAMFRQ